MIDYGLVFLASEALHSLVAYPPSKGKRWAVFAVSFISTALLMTFKLADTRYDMLIALLFPILKLVPFIMSIRDSLTTALEFKSHLINERSSDNANHGKLITFYRLYDTFM